MARILITGGAGFIGSHIAERFLKEGHEVTVVDNLSSGKMHYIPNGADFLKVDVKDEEAMADAVLSVRPDIINHHAAQINVRASIEDPVTDAAENILGSLSVLKSAIDGGVKRFIFASTGGAIYGSPALSALPVPEGSPELPESPYGAAKLAVEHYIRVLAGLSGLTYVILRYANVYGPKQVVKGESGVVAVFTQKLIEGKRPIIFGDGTHTRDYVYVKDVVEANFAALTKGDNNTINIATTKRIDVNEVYERIKALTGSDIVPIHGAEIHGEVAHIALDIKRAAEVLGWTPKYSFEQGLAETIDYYKSAVNTQPDG